MTTKAFKFSTFAFVLAAGLLTACSSDDDDNNVTPQEAPRLISVEVSEQPLASESAQAREMQTRSDITTTESLQNFKMYGVFNGETQGYNVTSSIIDGNKIWNSPGPWPSFAENNDVVSFYACSSGDFYANSNNPYTHFTILENASTQHDLLVAQNEASYKSSNGLGKVSLTFHHACAAIAFSVKITNTLSGRLVGNSLKVNKIELRNVKNTGKYYFKTNSWDDVSGSTYYTLSNSEIAVTTTPQSLSSNYLFVIPQSSDANETNHMYLDIDYFFQNQTKKAIIPLTVNWEAGKEYDIEIKLGTTLIQ